MKKSVVKYGDFVAAQVARLQPGTLAFLIQRFIREMNGLDGNPPVKTLGLSHEYELRRIQREPIALKVAAELDKKDFIAYARWRLQTVAASTVGQDICSIGNVLKYAGSAWDDCKGLTNAAIVAAKPYLVMHGLIGKSIPRHQRPTDDQFSQLLAFFAIQNARCNNKIDMVKFANWQRKSSRRLSESCRIVWPDWDRENHTIIVRKMKDPRNRNKDRLVALPEEAQAMLVEMWDIRDPNEPRIFPYNHRSVGAKYSRAKKILGFETHHLHDLRRDCGSRLVEEKGYSSAEAILVTGHETPQVFERTYLRMNPAMLKDGPLSKRGIKPPISALVISSMQPRPDRPQ